MRLSKRVKKILLVLVILVTTASARASKIASARLSSRRSLSLSKSQVSIAHVKDAILRPCKPGSRSESRFGRASAELGSLHRPRRKRSRSWTDGQWTGL